MPWVFLVKGKSLSVSSDDVYDLSNRIEESAEFRSASERARAASLVVQVAPDPDSSRLAVIVGHELYPSRHIYQGMTVSAPLPLGTENNKLLDSLAEELKALLESLGAGVEVSEGIVLNQFD
jgi:hypothetical protein